jgi:hypothetical protein
MLSTTGRILIPLASALAVLCGGCSLFMSPTRVITDPGHCCERPARKYKVPQPGPIRASQAQSRSESPRPAADDAGTRQPPPPPNAPQGGQR